MKFSYIFCIFVTISIYSEINSESDFSCVNNGRHILHPSPIFLENSKALPEELHDNLLVDRRSAYDELMNNLKEDLKYDQDATKVAEEEQNILKVAEDLKSEREALKAIDNMRNDHEPLSDGIMGDQQNDELLERKYRDLWSTKEKGNYLKNADMYPTAHHGPRERLRLRYNTDKSYKIVEEDEKPLPESLVGYRNYDNGDDDSSADGKDCKEANAGSNRNTIKDNRKHTGPLSHNNDKHQSNTYMKSKMDTDNNAEQDFAHTAFNINTDYPEEDDDKGNLIYNSNFEHMHRNFPNSMVNKRLKDTTKSLTLENRQKNPNMCYLCDECKAFDTETMNYLSQQVQRYETPSTTERRLITEMQEEYGQTSPKDASSLNSNQSKSYFSYQNSRINPALQTLSNDQLENAKNNLSHKANYKLSQQEQDGGEKRSNSSWLWRSNWGLRKRNSEHFNPMNEIKLKTSSRLMKKGFGPSLPSYSLGENRRELMIANILKRKEMELGKADRTINDVVADSAVEGRGKEMDQENGMHDFDVNGLEPILNNMDMDWNNIRTKRVSEHKIRRKREVKESDDKGEVMEQVDEEFKANQPINGDIGNLKRDKRSLGSTKVKTIPEAPEEYKIGIYDFEVNDLEPMLNAMDMNWNNIRTKRVSGKKTRSKREFNESGNKGEVMSQIHEKYKMNSLTSTNDDIGNLKRDNRTHGSRSEKAFPEVTTEYKIGIHDSGVNDLESILTTMDRDWNNIRTKRVSDHKIRRKREVKESDSKGELMEQVDEEFKANHLQPINGDIGNLKWDNKSLGSKSVKALPGASKEYEIVYKVIPNEQHMFARTDKQGRLENVEHNYRLNANNNIFHRQKLNKLKARELKTVKVENVINDPLKAEKRDSNEHKLHNNSILVDKDKSFQVLNLKAREMKTFKTQNVTNGNLKAEGRESNFVRNCHNKSVLVDKDKSFKSFQVLSFKDDNLKGYDKLLLEDHETISNEHDSSTLNSTNSQPKSNHIIDKKYEVDTKSNFYKNNLHSPSLRSNNSLKALGHSDLKDCIINDNQCKHFNNLRNSLRSHTHKRSKAFNSNIDNNKSTKTTKNLHQIKMNNMNSTLKIGKKSHSLVSDKMLKAPRYLKAKAFQFRKSQHTSAKQRKLELRSHRRSKAYTNNPSSRKNFQGKYRVRLTKNNSPLLGTNYSSASDKKFKAPIYSMSKAFRMKKSLNTNDKQRRKSFRRHNNSKAYSKNAWKIKSFKRNKRQRLTNRNKFVRQNNLSKVSYKSSQVKSKYANSKHLREEGQKAFDLKSNNFKRSPKQNRFQITEYKSGVIDNPKNFETQKAETDLLKAHAQPDAVKQDNTNFSPTKTAKDYKASETLNHIEPTVVKSKSSPILATSTKRSVESSQALQIKNRKLNKFESFRTKYTSMTNPLSNNSNILDIDTKAPTNNPSKSFLNTNLDHHKHHVKKREVSYPQQSYTYNEDIFHSDNDLDEFNIAHTHELTDNHLDSFNNDIKWHHQNSDDSEIGKALQKRQSQRKSNILEGNLNFHGDTTWWQENHKPLKDLNHKPLKKNPALRQIKSSRIPQRQPNRKNEHPSKKRHIAKKSNLMQPQYDINQYKSKLLANNRHRVNKFVKYLENTYNWPNDVNELYPSKRYWSNASVKRNTSLDSTSLDKSKQSTISSASPSSSDDSKKISLKLRNEILNCTAYSTLEEFLKSLPKNSTLKHNVTTTSEAPEEIEMEFTTLEIEDIQTTDNPDWNTTEDIRMENFSTSTRANDLLPTTYPDISFETTTIDCSDITEISNGEFNETLATPLPDIGEPTCDDSLSGGVTTTVFPPSSSMGLGKEDVNLNITINAKVQGNAMNKKFTGNGTIDVIPGFNDDRFRRHIYKQTLDGKEKRTEAYIQECDATASENAHDDDAFNDLASGKLSANIVKAVFGEVQNNPELRVLRPSLRHLSRLSQPSQMPNFYSIRNKDNKDEIRHTQNLFFKTMNAINDIIDQQVRSRSCVVLRPDLKEFYDLIVQTNEQSENRRDKRENPVREHNNAKRNDIELNSSHYEEKVKTLKNLLRQYDELPPEEQKEVEPIKQELAMELTELQKLSDGEERSKRTAIEQHNLSAEADNSNEISKLLEKYYTPEFLKLQKACDCKHELDTKSDGDEATNI